MQRIALVFALLLTAALPARAADLEANKKVVLDFYEKGLNQKDFDAAAKHFGPRYIQHNPGAPDGIEGFKAFIAMRKEKFPNARSEIKRVFAEYEDAKRKLSGGNLQKVVLGRWFDRDRICLLLDEPTRGVDVGGRNAIHEALFDLTTRNATIVIRSTDPDEIAALCNRVLVFVRGAVVAEITGDDITVDRLEHLTRSQSNEQPTSSGATP